MAHTGPLTSVLAEALSLGSDNVYRKGLQPRGVEFRESWLEEDSLSSAVFQEQNWGSEFRNTISAEIMTGR